MSRRSVSYHAAIKKAWKRASEKRARADKRALRAADEMAKRLLGNTAQLTNVIYDSWLAREQHYGKR